MAKAKGHQHRPDAATWSALKSFTAGLYDEMDKLSKKAPSATVSDLGLNRVNRAIKQAKDLMGAFDVYAAELAEFVPAGDNPEVPKYAMRSWFCARLHKRWSALMGHSV